MKCQNCKIKEAIVTYKENVNGKKQELHLCSECALKLGVGDFDNMFFPHVMSFESLFETREIKHCPKCGYTLDDYYNTGYLGCSECYKTFSDTLDQLFLKIHGKNRHKILNLSNNKNLKQNEVKNNKVVSDDDRIKELQDKIKQLVKEENYEEAAVIRDKIKKLQGK